ncbi:hypothetical protein [Streptomyces sp. KL118A]|nr:hypothetical protein [Streptomyces sp. KL118A]
MRRRPLTQLDELAPVATDGTLGSAQVRLNRFSYRAFRGMGDGA